ncbi:MAG: hypothetical protein ACE5GT_03575 [Rhodospirillales bacterium]
MVDDLDIYRTANELIKQHDEDAPIHAAMRADELLEAGDLEGQAVWKRISHAQDGRDTAHVAFSSTSPLPAKQRGHLIPTTFFAVSTAWAPSPYSRATNRAVSRLA